MSKTGINFADGSKTKQDPLEKIASTRFKNDNNLLIKKICRTL